MGDRTNCTLTVHGLISRSDLDAFKDLLQTWLHASEQEAESILDGEILDFEEINYGDFPKPLQDFLIERDVSFLWTWGAGGGYGAGLLAYDAIRRELASFDTIGGDVALRLSEMEDPARVQTARRADRGLEWKLAVYDSRHDLLAMLEQDRTAREFHEALQQRAPA